jgi:hypothetical protein
MSQTHGFFPGCRGVILVLLPHKSLFCVGKRAIHPRKLVYLSGGCETRKVNEHRQANRVKDRLYYFWLSVGGRIGNWHVVREGDSTWKWTEEFECA